MLKLESKVRKFYLLYGFEVNQPFDNKLTSEIGAFNLTKSLS